MRLTWPLTGRSEEMDVVQAAIMSAHLSGIVVRGAAGTGKSRLAREALALAAAKGCDTRWTVGTSSARAVPLGAFTAWVGSEDSATLHLVRRVIEALTCSSAGATVLIGVDDVHLIDDVSMFVLHQIIQRRAAKLVLTISGDDAVPPALHEIWRVGEFDCLDLQPLSRDETAKLLSAALGGAVDPDAVGRLWKLTRGNSLYLRNIVEHELAGGRFTQQRRYWRWIGQPVVPPGLVEIIESRIGALPDSVAEVVDTVAVGEPIGLELLNRITDPVAVEEADARGLIALEQVDGRVQVRVSHPLYAEVRRRRAPSTRLRRLRGVVVAELDTSTGRDETQTVVRRAALTLDSDLNPDRDLLVRGAQGAMRVGDLTLADRLADAGICVGGGVEARLVRAQALWWLGREREAEAVLADLSADTEVGDDRMTLLRACIRLWSLGDPDGAKAIIDASGSPAAALAVYWASMGKPGSVHDVAAALKLPELPGIVCAAAAWAIAAGAGDAGRVGEAVHAADAGYAGVECSSAAPHLRFLIADAHISALALSGQVGEACSAARRLREQAMDMPGAAHLLATAVMGRAALSAGRLHAAALLLDPAVELLCVDAGSGGFSYRYQLSRTIALAMRGSTDEAAASLAALDQEPHPGWQCLDWELALARAWVAASRGAVTTAVASVLSAAQSARVKGQFAAEVVCLQTAVQFGDASGHARLRELAQIVEGPRVGVAVRFAAALRAGDGPGLAAASEQFEEIGDRVAALDAAAQAAMVFGGQGLRGSAFGCASRADVLTSQCGGAATPALLRVANRLPLTAREREIAMLIRDGMSSRAVAERLTLSVRTVEGHLYRAMAKTGAASRDELAALLPMRTLEAAG